VGNKFHHLKLSELNSFAKNWETQENEVNDEEFHWNNVKEEI
jgi:hypothetical protein